MKKMIFLAVTMIATLTASAQQDARTWSITPKVGLNLANISGDEFGNIIKPGVVGGVEVQYQITPKTGISGGLFYSVQGCSYENEDAKFKLNELNIPVLIHLYVVKGLALKVGLQPGVILSASGKLRKTEADITGYCKSVEISMPVGFSYEISGFVFDARYNLGVSNINNSSIGLRNFSIRNSVIQFTVGYKISRL